MPFFLILLVLFLLFFLWVMRPRVRRTTRGNKSTRKWWPGGAEQKGRYVDFEELPDDGSDEASESSQKSAPTPSEPRIKDAEFEEIP